MTTLLPDRMTYLRVHALMAVAAMVVGILVLWSVGNPHVWTGAIGGLAAVALRGWYLMDEDLAAIWQLSPGALSGPAERHVPLKQIAKLRVIGATVQIIRESGDKHLIKFQSDPSAIVALISSATASAGKFHD